MKRLIFCLLLALVAWQGYAQYQSNRAAALARAEASRPASAELSAPDQALPVHALVTAVTPQFQCDGRTMCSQMTSCEEATFFLRNCPGTKMDGDHDGIPCEQQWCI